LQGDGIDGRLHGHDLLSDELFVVARGARGMPIRIVKRPRIGVDYAGIGRAAAAFLYRR
jgi:DNA-3-methyladenine glycosylase